MLTVTRKVYYCEHCKRHRLTSSAIEKHEPRCIYNPERSSCGWHERGDIIPTPPEWTEHLKGSLDLDWLRSAMNGCPACILAVVVQAGLTYEERSEMGFRYEDEVERYRERERDEVRFADAF